MVLVIAKLIVKYSLQLENNLEINNMAAHQIYISFLKMWSAEKQKEGLVTFNFNSIVSNSAVKGLV